MPLYLSLNSVYAMTGAPEGGHRQARFSYHTATSFKMFERHSWSAISSVQKLSSIAASLSDTYV
jgi:hypothetical protein